MSGPNFARGAQERAAKSVAQVQPTDIQVGGVGGVTFDPTTGQVTTTQAPERAAALAQFPQLQAQLGAGATQLAPGVTGFGQAAQQSSEALIRGATAFDPLQAAEERFARMQEALAPTRGRHEAALQEQLFRQGRLDSGIGAQQTAEQQAEFRLADLQALNELYGTAGAEQRAQLTAGLQAGAAGTTAQQSQFQQFLQGLQGQEQAATAPLRLAGASQGLAASEAARRSAAAGAIGNFNVAMAEGGSGSGIGSAIGGVVGGLGAGYLTGWNPAAMSAGATAGSNLGSFL